MKRDRKVEFLRVISMFMVLMLHSNGHGGGISHYEYGSLGYCIFWLVESFCMVSVNAFVLITGYYGTDSKFNLSRVLKFYIEVVAFSVICTMLAKILAGDTVRLMDWVYAVFPLTSRRYWFASNYAVLLFIQPILNLFIERIDKKTYKRLILVLLLLFSLIPTFLIWSRETVGTGMDVNWFIILYLVGAYIHKHGLSFQGDRWALWYIGLTILLYAFAILIPGIADFVIGSISGIGVFNYYNTIFVFAASVCFFMIFIPTKEGVSKHVSKSASHRDDGHGIMSLSRLGAYAFGAYLISDHRIIRSTLWEKVNITGVSDNPIIVLLYMIAVNIVFFIIGTTLDWIIKNVIKRLKPLFNHIDEKVSKIVN